MKSEDNRESRRKSLDLLKSCLIDEMSYASSLLKDAVPFATGSNCCCFLVFLINLSKWPLRFHRVWVENFLIYIAKVFGSIYIKPILYIPKFSYIYLYSWYSLKSHFHLKTLIRCRRLEFDYRNLPLRGPFEYWSVSKNKSTQLLEFFSKKVSKSLKTTLKCATNHHWATLQTSTNKQWFLFLNTDRYWKMKIHFC